MSGKGGAPRLPVVWRPRLGRVIPHALLPVVAACLIGLEVAMAPAVRSSDLALFGFIGVLVLVALYLVGRPRLVARESGLTVVNVLTSRSLEWAEVVGVAMAADDPWPTLDLADGSTMVAMAIQASDGVRARHALAELRTLLDRHVPPDPDA